MRSILGSILSIVYLIVGIVVAKSHNYFVHVHNLKGYASAALAIVLWPLVLAGLNFHLH